MTDADSLPLKTFLAALAEVEATLDFFEQASQLRPRLNDTVNWDVAGQLGTKPLVHRFLKSQLEESTCARALYVTSCAALESLLRELIRNAVQIIDKNCTEFDLLPQKIAHQNAIRSGLALMKVENPPPSCSLDFDTIAKQLGGCHSGSSAFVLNASAFEQDFPNIGQHGIETFVSRIGMTIDWDQIAKDESVAGVFEQSKTRERTKAILEFLKDAHACRNYYAHNGAGGPAASITTTRVVVKKITVIGIALTKAIHAFVNA